ncbi:hypothetical protein CVT26_012627 [Gymnopilus dilepis]|uniref:Uncharacterized protein n=1 Tax=Gymnopilus dilepis TaxID=231916 RepID=A0A409YW55_9AGAR|nr:hypothetical protein CVT26_012627 [Gymnopilus dilepis]
MSIFVRPESPPPRQPSPDIFLTPLPYPHPRRVHSQPRLGQDSPVSPPGLATSARTMHSSRSFDGFSSHTTPPDDEQCVLTVLRRPQTSSPFSDVSGTNSPHSLSPSSNSKTHVPSPPQTSVLHSHPARPKPSDASPSWPHAILDSKPLSKTTVLVRESDFGENRETPAASILEPKQSLPALEKHKSMGMACLRFFRFSGWQRQHRTAVAAL